MTKELQLCDDASATENSENTSTKSNPKRTNKLVRFVVLFAILAVAVSSSIFLTVLNVYGPSMEPTFNEGDLLLAVKTTGNFQEVVVEAGDVVYFKDGNKLLIKRVIAIEGQLVDMDDDGNVTVDGEVIQESYLTEKSLGESNIDFPVRVSKDTYFLMGDNRYESIDSRNSAIGCVDKATIEGKVLARFWPLSQFSFY